jgi:hypothetical protein
MKTKFTEGDTVKIVAESGNLKVYVNGQEVANPEDYVILVGKPGELQVDDFSRADNVPLGVDWVEFPDDLEIVSDVIKPEHKK